MESSTEVTGACQPRQTPENTEEVTAMPRLRNKDAGTGDVRAVKYVSGTDGHGRRLECHFDGFLTDKKGIKWALWSSCENRLSAMIRLEAPGKRAWMMYDPGGHFRRTVRLAGGHLVK